MNVSLQRRTLAGKLGLFSLVEQKPLHSCDPQERSTRDRLKVYIDGQKRGIENERYARRGRMGLVEDIRVDGNFHVYGTHVRFFPTGIKR